MQFKYISLKKNVILFYFWKNILKYDSLIDFLFVCLCFKKPPSFFIFLVIMEKKQKVLRQTYCIFLYNLNVFLLRNVILFVFGQQFFKYDSLIDFLFVFALKAPLFIFLVIREKKKQNVLQRTTHMYTRNARIFKTFLPYQLHKVRFYCISLRFGMTPGVNSFFHTVLLKSMGNEMVGKIKA